METIMVLVLEESEEVSTELFCPLLSSVKKENVISVFCPRGLCDNLLTFIVRAWDFSKPLFVAPAMNTYMWNNPFKQRHLDAISELGISLVPPITKRLACGDYRNGAMVELSDIYSTVMLAVDYGSQTNGNIVLQ
ncbi:hypothetical protein MKW94_012152 [Papaver nudicaule]|uniref:Phosphopantothenoylcysteine decarboxylase n=1 Tax=Papaver nudicaule TaxID=74823 RepID=A0AA42B315_PAPNU|nr:hypothetical protein [Papaver nudicaule]